MRRRHHRRVFHAAARAGRADERQRLDDWIVDWLRRTRRDARHAGMDAEAVDAITLDGLVAGRNRS